MSLFKVIFLTMLVVFSGCLIAETTQQIDTCEKVIVVGDPTWTPYTVVGDDDHIYGIGMELVETIFSELDIPVEKTVFYDERKMMHSLSLGTIDILVSAYNTERLAQSALIIPQGYINDPVTVAVNKKYSRAYTNWEDLVGHRGSMSKDLHLEDNINSELNKFLHINRYNDFRQILEGIREDTISFVVGSGLQLIHEIEKSGLKKKIKIARKLSKGSNVHMAMSKRSACTPYAHYLERRLQEARRDGQWPKLSNKYIPK